MIEFRNKVECNVEHKNNYYLSVNIVASNPLVASNHCFFHFLKILVPELIVPFV